ncbi:MAG: DUF3606 domain-containing protein [Burkholderiales bacterium]|nr:MAG: DUF3606 domain-containing protein [Burkholderiales bacterium]
MADDKNATGEDRRLISLTEDYEVRDWAQSFGVSEAALRAAVEAVGHSAQAVRAHLQKQ